MKRYTYFPTPKPIKTPRAVDPVTSDAQGQWLVLLAGGQWRIRAAQNTNIVKPPGA